MNAVDAYVTKVLEPPTFIDKYPDVQWWEVGVEYDSYGVLSETKLTFRSKDEANRVCVGYRFLA